MPPNSGPGIYKRSPIHLLIVKMNSQGSTKIQFNIMVPWFIAFYLFFARFSRFSEFDFFAQFVVLLFKLSMHFFESFYWLMWKVFCNDNFVLRKKYERAKMFERHCWSSRYSFYCSGRRCISVEIFSIKIFILNSVEWHKIDIWVHRKNLKFFRHRSVYSIKNIAVVPKPK